jgi:uncharacterized protein YndB with AHSA1/START domain
MSNPSVTHATYTIERSYPIAPERVFAAFTDPAKKRRWFADSETGQAESYELNFKVGGNEVTRRIIQGGPYKGTPLTNHSSFQDIIPSRRIVFAYTMSMGDTRISASLATVELLPTEKGTTLLFTDQAAFFEGADGAPMREQGWRKLFEGLEKELARQ